MPIGVALETNYAYKYATESSRAVLESSPKIRRNTGEDGLRSDDEVKHHNIDPWAASAPEMSDLLRHLDSDLPTNRNKKLEDIQARVASYRTAYKKHHKRSKFAVGARLAALAVDAVGMQGVASQFVQAGQMQALGMVGAAHASHLAHLAEGAIAVGANAVEGANEMTIHETQMPRNNQAARLEEVAQQYPEYAEQFKLGRNSADPLIRQKLGEHGRSAYYGAIRKTDDLVPAYLQAVAKTAHAGDCWRGTNISHFGFAPAREYVNVMSDTGATDLSRQLLASTVREYGHLAEVFNRRYQGRLYVQDSGVIERMGSLNTADTLAHAEFPNPPNRLVVRHRQTIERENPEVLD